MGCSFRYIESMVHYVSVRHPAAILDDLHGKVLNEAYQISKSTVTESVGEPHQLANLSRSSAIKRIECDFRLTLSLSCFKIFPPTIELNQAGEQAIKDGGYHRLPQHATWPNGTEGQTRQREDQGPAS